MVVSIQQAERWRLAAALEDPAGELAELIYALSEHKRAPNALCERLDRIVFKLSQCARRAHEQFD